MLKDVLYNGWFGFDYANQTESQDSSDLQLQQPDDAYYMLIIGNIFAKNLTRH